MPEVAGWRPAKDTHAIHTANVSVQFGQPAGDVLWRRVDHSVAQEAGELGLTERQPVGFSLPPQLQQMMGALFDAAQSEAGAGYLKRENPTFYSEQIQVTRDQVKYEQWEYTRWAPFMERARRLMAHAINRYSENSGLVAVAATYVDAFEHPDIGADVAAVIDRESPMIARGAFQPSVPWHSHAGWFDYPDSFARRLRQVNVDLVDRFKEDGVVVRAVQITTTLTDQFGQRGIDPLTDEHASWEFVEGRLNQLHAGLKTLLARVLTKDAAQAISLR